MKFATIDQKDEIIKKIIETFKIRRYLYLNEQFFDVFPRFLDIPELVSSNCSIIFLTFYNITILMLYNYNIITKSNVKNFLDPCWISIIIPSYSKRYFKCIISGVRQSHFECLSYREARQRFTWYSYY